ncbi:MAG: GHKL domain-containing protein [Bacteroidales bacterium]|nr:GHKL domain-containing protein [Bacteroidales bacterium]
MNNTENYYHRFEKAQRVLNRKIKKVDKILEDIEFKLDSIELGDLMTDQGFLKEDIYKNEGIVILGFSSDSLVYWSDNSIPVENYFIDNELYSSVAKLKNGWFVIRQNYIDDYELFALILLKNEYSYQNEFVKSDFFPEYEIDVRANVELYEDVGFNVNDLNNNYLFSFVLDSNTNSGSIKSVIVSFLYLLTLIFLFIGVRVFFKNYSGRFSKGLLLIILGFVLILIRYLMLKYHLPNVFRQLDLFQPHHFAISFIVPSLGDLLIHTTFAFYFFYIFFETFEISFSHNKFVNYLISASFIFFSFGLFYYVNHFFKSLILHSSISFEIYKFFDLSIYSLIGFVIVILMLASFFLFVDRFAQIVSKRINLKIFLILFSSILILIALAFWLANIQISIVSFVFYIILIGLVFVIRVKKENYSYGLNIVLLLLFALYTVLFISITSSEKDSEKRKVLAVNLSNEHDQIAEMLLAGLEEKIQQDTIVRDLLKWPHENEGAIFEHLQMTYFSGYFRKYDLAIDVCAPNDDLTLDLENSVEIVACYNFFNDLFKDNGTQIQESCFYFIDNLNGVVSYSGEFIFKKIEWYSEVSLFIHLDSKLISQELGYPELLLDSKITGSTILTDYSYAKYKNEDLMTRSGNFSYQLTLPDKWKSGEEFFFINDKDYQHLLYKIDESTIVIISNVRLKFIDVLASFSYIFVLYYIIFTIVLFLLRFPGNIKNFNYDFKNKIKFSMIGVLLLSLIIIGSGTIFYNINQFEKKLYESIGEKIQSVLVEMEHKLGGAIELDSDYSDYLPYLLTKFSNVFFTDINLYDTKGNLLASSQSQVFEKGLMGSKMNNDAFKEMVIQKRGRFIHKESIGDLSYYSAYVPFRNDNKELLAYLNLPYFTKQSALKKEIYTIIVAVVNIYFFLILLSVIVAIFISNNITKPLQLIQERFKAIDLGKKNEPIEYQSQDEIGSLIKEYNRMVSELSENAEKLAKSERESAWREMAKQIAHEIKNPLTPMKLSVQYLQKSWKEDIPDFDKRLEKFSNSLISQINSLSKIATEFSNFAKMPRAREEQVDIIAKLTDAISLFENTENIRFTNNFKNKEYYVFVDKEQLLIIVSNLIKNGIQAISKNRKGLIDIKVEDITNYIKVSITDNGTGIPNELKDKLFIPNFTTKTSGMGLGLAIVKNMVENYGGEIGYSTEIDVGTSFFVTFPKYNPDN